MKNIFLPLAVAAVLFAACEKELDQTPVSNITTDNFYTNTNDFQQAVNGAYYQLVNYPNQALWLSELRSDNIAAESDGVRDWQGINDFSPNITTTGFIVSAWNNNFNGIYNVNTVLQALEDKGSLVLTNELKTRFTGESRFLRAFYYFQLLRVYGKVPVIDKPLSAIDVSAVKQGSIAEVYDFIIQDLEYAAANLPATYTGTDIGRATSNAAKGLLGLVYLTKSGPTFDIEGPGLNSGEYDKALTLFNQVLNSGNYAFLQNYSSIFSYSNENNKEVIFDIQFKSSTNGAAFPSQLVPVGYWTSIGISNTYGNGYGASNFAVSADLKQSYKNSAGTATDIRDAYNIMYSYTSPFIKKYIDITKKGTSGTDWPVNFIVLRYTDVLMMKAECILHGATGSQAQVDSIVNVVRQRAGINPVTDVTIETLVEERRREFLGEGLRWNDLVREGLVINTMNNWIKNDDLTTISEVIPNYIIYPIPAAELQTKVGLYNQNPGYN